MRNIILFVGRHFNLILFLFLQLFSIYLIVRYSQYHQASFGRTFNRASHQINDRYARIARYFDLQRVNDSLIAVQENLFNKQASLQVLSDTIAHMHADTSKIDSIVYVQKYRYKSAFVVSNSVSQMNNYIVVDKGTEHGIGVGMGVVNMHNQLVGIVTDVDKQYAAIMSVLHKDSHISGKLQRGGEVGTLSWDGALPNHIFLTGIPKSAKVTVGDTVITSGFSTAFPKGVLIGRVTSFSSDPSSHFQTIKIKTAADFYNLPYVHLIIQADAQKAQNLIDKVQNKP